MKWSATDGWVKAKGAAKGAASLAGQAIDNSKTGQRFANWMNEGLDEEYDPLAGTPYGNTYTPAGQPSPAQTGTGVPPASAGSGRNKPLPKRPQKQGGGGKPASDDEINQFREWQGSQSQWSGLGKGKGWKNYSELSGIGMNYDRSQYKFHDVAARSSGRRRGSPNVNEDAGEDTRPATVAGGKTDMTPEQKADDDWSAQEKTFTPDDLPVGTYTPPANAGKAGYDDEGLPT